MYKLSSRIEFGNKKFSQKIFEHFVMFPERKKLIPPLPMVAVIGTYQPSQVAKTAVTSVTRPLEIALALFEWSKIGLLSVHTSQPIDAGL